MKPLSRRQRIAAQLADLKMPGTLESLDEVLAGVEGGGFTAREAIERLLAAQIALRNSRRRATAMRSSRLPAVKTLADFDFGFQPSIRREQIDELHDLGFVERRDKDPGGLLQARRGLHSCSGRPDPPSDTAFTDNPTRLPLGGTLPMRGGRRRG